MDGVRIIILSMFPLFSAFLRERLISLTGFLPLLQFLPLFYRVVKEKKCRFTKIPQKYLFEVYEKLTNYNSVLFASWRLYERLF